MNPRNVNGLLHEFLKLANAHPTSRRYTDGITQYTKGLSEIDLCYKWQNHFELFYEHYEYSQSNHPLRNSIHVA